MDTHRACRRVRLIWADAGYTGQLARASLCRPNYQTLTKLDSVGDLGVWLPVGQSCGDM